MKINFFIVVILFFNVFLHAQQKNTDKIELELQKYTQYYGNSSGYRSTTDITPYIIINGIYIEDKKYDKKFFKNIFSDCSGAYKKSLNYLNLMNKSSRLKRKGMWLGLAVSAGGLAYYMSKKNSNTNNKYYVLGTSFLAGAGVNYIFNSKSTNTRHSAYKKLKSSIDFYDKNCYADLETTKQNNEKDNNQTAGTIKSKSKNKYARKYEITVEDLKNISFLSLKPGIGLEIGFTTLRLTQYTGMEYYKNGFSLSTEFDFSIFGFHDSEELNDYNAYPVNPGKYMYGNIGLVYPILKKLKPKRTIIKLGKTRGIDAYIESKDTKYLISWGPVIKIEYEKSLKSPIDVKFLDESVPFGPETNSLKIPIKNVLFYQSSSNLLLGLNRTLFSSATLKTNDSRFAKIHKITNLIQMYAAVKLNLNRSFDDMVYSTIITSKEIPVTFTDDNFIKTGFVTGFSVESIKKHSGYSFSVEGGLNPHIDHTDYKDYYLKLKIGLVFGKIY